MAVLWDSFRNAHEFRATSSPVPGNEPEDLFPEVYDEEKEKKLIEDVLEDLAANCSGTFDIPEADELHAKRLFW
ncbi:unnamed protein product [Gongylonema pulchrum]|uniref:Rab3 GTPase-activating protein catalytic subunit n=1 Tax=Gongylonema pulchrum TaxID=637853 RepID=A0A183EWI1_9BILA|nr:unnamed protein product [Gongylonema pulchrum]